ncbi:hypothetical protein GCM10010124_26460 [Pilimelia terevasa]|uniref:Uncharacterized protein n=1 Tax=Pilimelia terevasa TaxID=53372 RepID=A0A8J3BR78_9ACTN|nr:hypothetical protein [Pilimelia terevasa]GGK32385.1 hypothetical protein GCM10010124_26460 [Pilimelia terevasa]
MREDEAVEWISGAQAAAILGVSARTVLRTLQSAAAGESTQWGERGVGWRHKPLSTRGAFQVSRQVAERIAAES